LYFYTGLCFVLEFKAKKILFFLKKEAKTFSECSAFRHIIIDMKRQT